MFRKPMRLEKWIAFDGAVGAEVLQLVNDAAPDVADNADSHDNIPDAPDVEAFTFVEAAAAGGIDTRGQIVDVPDLGRVTINFPTNPIDYPSNGDPLFIFRDGGVAFTLSNKGSGVNGTDFEISLSAPADGDFRLLDFNEVQGNVLNGLQEDDWIALVRSDYDDMVVFRQIVNDGGNLKLSNEATVSIIAEFTRGADGSISLRLSNNGGGGDGNFKIGEALETLLNSLVFDPDDAGSTAEKIGEFEVSVSYDGAPVGDTVTVGAGDDGGGDGGGGDPGGGGDEPGDGETGDQPPYVPPVNPPGDPGGGENSGGESGGEGETGGGDAGGEGGSGGDDSGGDADSGSGDVGGDDMNYIFRQDDLEDRDDADGDGEAAGNSGGQADSEAEIVVALEDRTMETAAAVTAAELAREVEYLLTTVRGERDVLLGSLSRLQEEYLRKGGRVLDEDFRALLRKLFESGNSEKEAMNRIIAEMNRQIAAYRAFNPAFRDGMLTESLRELVDSAERRTGETGALSQAIDAVVRMLSREGALPDADEVQAMFEKTHADALRKWHEKAELSDPMGKELAVTEREAATAN